MKCLNQTILSLAIWLAVCNLASAALVVTVAQPESTGSKAIVSVGLQNTYSQKIESARAVMFLVDDQGKVVGQDTRWIIGGTKDKPALDPSGQTKFNFVITAPKPYKKTQLIVTRIILEDGKYGNIQKDVQIVDVTR